LSSATLPNRERASSSYARAASSADEKLPRYLPHSFAENVPPFRFLYTPLYASPSLLFALGGRFILFCVGDTSRRLLRRQSSLSRFMWSTMSPGFAPAITRWRYSVVLTPSRRAFRLA
jgi:hypothetical protein